MSWKPQHWPQWARAWSAAGAFVAGLALVSQGQAALSDVEWALPAHRGYVRDVVMNKAADDAVRMAQAEAKSDAHFAVLEGLLLQQNVTTLESKLKILRPQLASLQALLDEKPGNTVLISGVADTTAEISDTEDMLRSAKCKLNNRGLPDFGNC